MNNNTTEAEMDHGQVKSVCDKLECSPSENAKTSKIKTKPLSSKGGKVAASGSRGGFRKRK